VKAASGIGIRRPYASNILCVLRGSAVKSSAAIQILAMIQLAGEGWERIAPRVSAVFGTQMVMRPERPAHFT